MECINAASLRRKSGQWGTQLWLGKENCSLDFAREAANLLIFRAKSSSFKRICHPDRSAAQWGHLLFLSVHPI
jgi:hypothetical protein